MQGIPDKPGDEREWNIGQSNIKRINVRTTDSYSEEEDTLIELQDDITEDGDEEGEDEMNVELSQTIIMD